MLNRLKIIITILLIAFAINSVTSQNNTKTLIHAHNDYLQNIPFWNAFSNGATSIEIDVHLKNNKLYVAHTQNEIDTSRTLETLYLKPLQTAMQMKLSNINTLQLMIDVKSNAHKTLNKIIKTLKLYPAIINHKNISIIISGNRPNPKLYNNYPNFIWFDHQDLNQKLSTESLNKVAMVSLDFKKYSDWNGKGRLTHEDYTNVAAIISKAKKLNKPFRFWGTPDSKTAWKAFIDLGVNVINTDLPFQCVSYTKTLANRIYNATTITSKVYKPHFKYDGKQQPVKNIILMIGDGNGLTQISSAALANGGQLSLTQLKNIGLLKTQSADDFTTDSAAAATALATGTKTNNRAIGTDPYGKTIKNITEILNEKGYSTGIITTDWVTGATPASFYAHQKDRSQTSLIANNLITSKLNVFIAGGGSIFRRKSVNKTFKMVHNINAIATEKSDRVGLFLSGQNLPSVMQGRDNILANATKNSLAFFEKKEKPFFLMVEAAKIDSFGHANDTNGIITETIDFDKAITEALKFADKNPDTLVLITADHETSGFSIPHGNLKTHSVEGDFTTHDHTGTMVPIFAYGPQSNMFNGVYENNDVFHKILKCILKN
ncbi:alkaline phosphatase [Seonamhaeicola algicola]|uniref:Alkaline phosphatase n=1 Tax=Seonamhaeicola algicola TaxID=1719036 RepID=A0A5C7AGR8_9FLAO|nr:alkaline phosphatase [Seonamhaeicola algicola]TXE07194.1 alkaline phosphatase [Seonamhaeicola algicola]